jgi:adenosylmethionine-8-amino-7-oxononanoate aminotransferase
MTPQKAAVCVMLLALVAIRAAPAQTTRQEAATATHGMVATGHPIATDAAVQVLRDGGNASRRRGRGGR